MVVNYSILWDESIVRNFLKTCQYLTITEKLSIIMNPENLVFCRKILKFVGFELSEECIKPENELLTSIKEFSRPKDI